MVVPDGAPEDRCGFLLASEDVEWDFDGSRAEWHERTNAACCFREPWDGRDRCRWHARTDGKSAADLPERSDTEQCLDGTYLVGASVGDDRSFEGCSLVGLRGADADFEGCSFSGATLAGADLTGATLRGAALDGADLVEATLDGADLGKASVTDANLRAASLVGVTGTGATFRNASLRGVDMVDADLGGADFREAGVRGSNVRNANLGGATFVGADVGNTVFEGSDLGGAAFEGADGTWASFADAELWGVEFEGATLRYAEFDGANLRGGRFPDATLEEASFTDAELGNTAFPGASLRNASFADADLDRAEFPDASLRGVSFPEATLSGAGFDGADLTEAYLDRTDARDASFAGATLRDATFDRTDLRATDFRDAGLYQAIFTDVRVNGDTTFGVSDPPTESRHRAHSSLGPLSGGSESPSGTVDTDHLSVYEAAPGESQLEDGTEPLEAAAWVYRRLESLHEDNAIAERARQYHLRKEEANRKYQRRRIREAGDTGERLDALSRYATGTLTWHLTRHGESLYRILEVAFATILVSGLLFPLVGGVASDTTGTEYAIGSLSELVSRGGLVDLAHGLYFSVITFTTIGYGDLYPSGVGSKLLVGAESLLGALLIALFVFVLGRRVAR